MPIKTSLSQSQEKSDNLKFGFDEDNRNQIYIT